VVEVPIEIAKYFYSQLFQFLSVSGKQMFFFGQNLPQLNFAAAGESLGFFSRLPD
jgi:hypothetical protein